MITIYGTSQCKVCHLAKELCEKNDLKYEFKNIEFKKFRDELSLKIKEIKEVPIVFNDDEYVGLYHNFLYKIEKIKNQQKS